MFICAVAGLLRAFTAPEMLKGVKCEKCCPEANGDGPAQGAPQAAYTKHIKTVSFGKVMHYAIHFNVT